MRAFEYIEKTVVVHASLDISRSPVNDLMVGKLAVMVNGVPMSSATTVTIGAITVRRNAPSTGRSGSVVIETPMARIAIIMKWRPKRGKHADFLDFNAAITAALPRPVTGVLAPSYLAATALKDGVAIGSGVATVEAEAVMESEE
jgi:hypothetical protein